MTIKDLNIVIEDLQGLQKDYYLAKMTTDMRKRDKQIRDAKLNISNYAHSLSAEVRGYLNDKVGVNALNYQWVDGDIDECIKALKDCVTTMPTESDM